MTSFNHETQPSSTPYSEEKTDALLDALFDASGISRCVSPGSETHSGVLDLSHFLVAHEANYSATLGESRNPRRPVAVVKEHLNKLDDLLWSLALQRSKLEAKLSHTTACLQTVEEARQQLHSLCAQAEAAIQPSVRLLPPELLLEVGRLLVEDFHNDVKVRLTQHEHCPDHGVSSNSVAQVLAAVCKRWRRVFLHDATLWSRICLALCPDSTPHDRFPSQLAMARTHIRLSRNHPLHICLFTFPDTGNRHGDHSRAVLNTLLEQAQRWETAVLYLRVEDTFVLPTAFPLLKDLTVHISPPLHPLEYELQTIRADGVVMMPALSNLRTFMDSSDLPLFATQGLQAKVLTCLHVSWWDPVGLDKIFWALDRSRSTLRELRLTQVLYWTNGPAPLELSTLEVLSIRVVHKRCSQALLSALTTPRLQKFEFVGGWLPAEVCVTPLSHVRHHRHGLPSVATFRQFVERSVDVSRSLRSLQIVDPDANAEHIENVLKLFPAVTSLYLMLEFNSPVFSSLSTSPSASNAISMPDLAEFTYLPVHGEIEKSPNPRLLDMVSSRLMVDKSLKALNIVQCTCATTEPRDVREIQDLERQGLRIRWRKIIDGRLKML
ncbi:hypothetical protein V5O48_014986 [Marasmius crinis-equi]|uniref:F-box domain-containing protein n=1 Tax=Marasmius crinis-equi TaxID=585013 RepID=A0ABR3EW33_9AGAR